jgi:polysaccharide export outer membrane protein
MRFMKKYFYNVARMALLLSMVFAASCTSPPPKKPEQKVPQSPVLSDGYVLSVKVMVAGEKEVDVKGCRVREDGTLDLPLLGAVNARGKTLKELNDYLREEYGRRFFVNPRVTVSFDLAGEVDMYPWGYVTVLGRVKKPGSVRIPATRDLTITQCIQKAGGFIEYAKKSAIRITRRDPETGKNKKITVDFKHMAESAGEKDLLLKPGDTVYVPEVLF